jgi:hypothetical protein
MREWAMLYRMTLLLSLVLGLVLSSPSLAGSLVATGPVQQAQLPPPFGVQPGPQLPGREQCTPERRKRLQAQIDGYQRLQSLSRNEGEQICSLLERTDDLGKLADGKIIEQLLPPEAREFLKALGVDFAKTDMRAVLRMLGVDLDSLDFRKIKAQCRLTQGEADRLFTSEIGRLKRELLGCEDTI